MNKYIVIVFSLLISSSVFGASFNCNKAATKLELLICENNELSDLDSQLGTLYSKLRKSLSADEKRKLKKEQILWIKQRNRCGLSNDCLIYSYEVRILELEELNDSDSVKKSNCKNVILKEYEPTTIFGDVADGSNCYELSINSEQKQKLIDIKLNSMCDNAVFSLIGVSSDAIDHHNGKIKTGKYQLFVSQLFCRGGCSEKERYEINITLLDDKSIFEKIFEKSESLVTEITFLPEKLQEINATNMIRLSPSFFKGAKSATDSYRRELAVKFQMISKSIDDVKTMEDLTNKIDFRGINYNELFPSYKEILMLTNFQFWDSFSKELYSQTEKDSLNLLSDIDSRFDMFYTKEEGTEKKRYVFKAGYISTMISLSYASKSILDSAMSVANKIAKKNNSIKKVSKWIDSNKIIATAYNNTKKKLINFVVIKPTSKNTDYNSNFDGICSESREMYCKIMKSARKDLPSPFDSYLLKGSMGNKYMGNGICQMGLYYLDDKFKSKYVDVYYKLSSKIEVSLVPPK